MLANQKDEISYLKTFNADLLQKFEKLVKPSEESKINLTIHLLLHS